MSSEFAHLHVHSEYSMLDGAARIKDLIKEATGQGMRAVGITDHGNMHGTYDFYREASKAGITPVVGIEAYVAPGSRTAREKVAWGTPEQKSDDVSGGGAFTHMTMWAQNKTGLHNLFRLSSRAFQEGYYYKGRMDFDLISQHSEGIIATTGCPSGEVQTRLRLGQYDQAFAAAARYRDLFGRDNYYVELMDHGLGIESRVREELLDIARKLRIMPVVTNDSHYVYAGQKDAHEALLCVQTGNKLNNSNRFKFDGNGYYIKSSDEMYSMDYSRAWQLGCKQTLVIAEKIDTTGMFESKNMMPKFPIPDGYTEDSYFHESIMRGCNRLFPSGLPENYQKQLDYEIGILSQMGFLSYFLVVADFVTWAKNNGIYVGPGRGSAAGSLVSYLLGITGIDPIEHKLIFERFLNPERVSMPDIDIDFDDRRRGEVIQYVMDKWGKEYVAQVVTFGKIKAKAAIKDSCRVLDLPYALGDKLSKAMPHAIMGKDAPLSCISDPEHSRYEEAAGLREIMAEDDNAARAIELARGLEGLVRQTGIHAAGVIVSSEPLIDNVPLMVNDGNTLTQFDFPMCDSLGLMKMDFLGLRNLTVISDAIANIKTNHGIDVDLHSLPLDDSDVFDLLRRGETLGVFQLDSPQLRSLLRLMQPTSFDDISAVIALYRPGPMGANSHTNYALRKNGQQEIEQIHPELASVTQEVLGETYGLIIYQEQVQFLAQRLAGYSLGKADLLRRAMGKKKKEILDKEYIPFRDGMFANGYSEDAVKTIWEILVPFADYAFNRAHSASYGMISYWTAYLKAHYPVEYMAALLTSVGDDKDKMSLYLAECRRLGIKVTSPDTNESSISFTPVGGKIRFGLKAVKNLGSKAIDSILTERSKGRFESFTDFVQRVDISACNSRSIDSLIQAGAFDAFGDSRKSLSEHCKDILNSIRKQKKKVCTDQMDMFALLDEPVTDLYHLDSESDWPKQERLAREREILGLYVSDHPLSDNKELIYSHTINGMAEIAASELPASQPVFFAGLIYDVTYKTSKNGEPWCIAHMEDMETKLDVLFFPRVFEQVGEYIIPDIIVKVAGKVNYRDGEVSVFGNDIALIL